MEINDDDRYYEIFVQQGMINDAATFCSHVMGAQRRGQSAGPNNIIMELKDSTLIKILEYSMNARKACPTVVVDDVELSLAFARLRGAEMVGDIRGKIIDPFGNLWMLVSEQQNPTAIYKLFGFLYGLLKGFFNVWMGISTVVGAVVTTAIACICLCYWLEFEFVRVWEKAFISKLGHKLFRLPRWLIGWIFGMIRR